MKEETLDLVNENDIVIGKAPRDAFHKGNDCIHRSVHILVINKKAEIFIKRRAKNKLYQGQYESSAGGHVMSGETYDDAAKRELKEELGIDENLTKIRSFKCFNQIEKRIICLYLCYHNGPFRLDKQEADFGKFFSVQELLNDIIHNRREFTTGTRMAIGHYLGWLNENNRNI